MRATVIHGAGDVRVETVPDPVIQRPTDALVRADIGELLPDVLDGRLQPGRVFDRTVGPDGYRAMADRKALKVLITA